MTGDGGIEREHAFLTRRYFLGLNGEWLTGERGGPVRMIVPGAYGFKSIKWLTRVVLTNDHRANDTYAGQHNDIDRALKTYARFRKWPEEAKAGARLEMREGWRSRCHGHLRNRGGTRSSGWRWWWCDRDGALPRFGTGGETVVAGKGNFFARKGFAGGRPSVVAEW